MDTSYTFKHEIYFEIEIAIAKVQQLVTISKRNYEQIH